MKKITLIISSIILVLTLASCDTDLVDIPIDPVPELVPPVEPEVTQPEVSTEEPEVVTEPTEVTPEVVIEYIDRFIEVPAEVERQRRYRPGMYLLAEATPNNQNGYVFVVLTVDAYGMIASVYIDQTISTRVLHRSPQGQYYLYVEGNARTIPNSYRLIDPSLPLAQYPTVDDAIRAGDLTVGIDNTEIRQLTRVSVNETKQIASDRVSVTSELSYQEQMQAVAAKVIQDNTTYGFNLVETNGIITTSSIAGIDQPLDVPLALIQSILDGPAALTNPNVLANEANPVYGLYTPGVYQQFSTSFDQEGALNHAISIITVDRFGRLISVYIDETSPSVARSNVFATKKILGDSILAPGGTTSWGSSVKLIEDQIIRNQGMGGFQYEETGLFGVVRPTLTPFTTNQPVFVANVPNNTVAMNQLLAATFTNLEQAKFQSFIDGVYVVQDQARNEVAIVTLENNEIIDVVFDRFVAVDQAQIFRQNQVVSVFEFPRTFGTPTGSFVERVRIYQIGANAYSAQEITHINNILLPESVQIANDQLVTLSLQERQQLTPVSGFQPATQLAQTNSSQQTWVTQARFMAEAFIETADPTAFQVTSGGVIDQDELSLIQASPYFTLVTRAYQLAKTPGNQVQSLPTSFLPVPLADGSYLTYQTPSSQGIGYSYLSVREGQVRSWVVDQVVTRNNVPTTILRSTLASDQTLQTELKTLSAELVREQINWITNVVEKPAPDPEYNSIRGSILASNTTYSLPVYQFIPALNQAIAEAANAKLAQDMTYIYEFFQAEGQPLATPRLLAFQTKTRWLPSSIRSQSLSYAYALEWSSDRRDVDIRLDGAGYTFVVDRLDADGSVPLTLEIFLPGENRPYVSYTYDLTLQRRATYGQSVLNSSDFDLPSRFLLEGTAFTLPTSSELSIVWLTSDTQTISAAGQTVATEVERTATLTAFVDLDGNGERSSNEPSRDYSITVLPRTAAVARVLRELDTSQIGEYINPELRLSTNSSVWGLTYSWSSSSPQVRISTSSGISSVTIAKLDFQIDIPLTVTFNLPNTTDTQTYRLDAGNKTVYEEFTLQDLPVLTTSNSMIPGQSLFASLTSKGSKYGSDISFITTDFGQFVNSSGVIIYQHPTIDACFELRLTSSYSGGVTMHSTTVVEPFCVLSTRSLQQRMNQDRDALQDVIVDRSTFNHIDVSLQLPKQGSIHQFPVLYSLRAGQSVNSGLIDLSDLSSGMVRLTTTDTALSSQPAVVLVATVEVPLFNGAVLRVSRDVTIRIKE